MINVSKKRIELNDFDILGVGAVDRQQIQQSSGQHSYILLRHNLDFLPGILESTLAWLQPDEIIEVRAFSKERVCEETFRKLFSFSLQYFGEARKVYRDYMLEMPWNEGLVRDHFRYFPEFIRRRFSAGLYYELFLWEWTRAYLSYVDLGDFSKSEPQNLKVNISLMVCALTDQTAAVLKRDPGLYAHVYSVRLGRVTEKHLTIIEAEILDLLSEDRKYSETQLFEMLAVGSQVSNEKYVQALAALRESDIIKG